MVVEHRETLPPEVFWVSKTVPWILFDYMSVAPERLNVIVRRPFDPLLALRAQRGGNAQDLRSIYPIYDVKIGLSNRPPNPETSGTGRTVRAEGAGLLHSSLWHL
ncbi:MAG TPA: hypothetical protein DD856_07790 [Sulfobacillus sp.]|nr:hypothetical protein [Sulfobacillus sp.]